jgi:hypothetical protein
LYHVVLILQKNGYSELIHVSNNKKRWQRAIVTLLKSIKL